MINNFLSIDQKFGNEIIEYPRNLRRGKVILILWCIICLGIGCNHKDDHADIMAYMPDYYQFALVDTIASSNRLLTPFPRDKGFESLSQQLYEMAGEERPGKVFAASLIPEGANDWNWLLSTKVTQAVFLNYQRLFPPDEVFKFRHHKIFRKDKVSNIHYTYHKGVILVSNKAFPLEYALEHEDKHSVFLKSGQPGHRFIHIEKGTTPFRFLDHSEIRIQKQGRNHWVGRFADMPDFPSLDKSSVSIETLSFVPSGKEDWAAFRFEKTFHTNGFLPSKKWRQEVLFLPAKNNAQILLQHDSADTLHIEIKKLEDYSDLAEQGRHLQFDYIRIIGDIHLLGNEFKNPYISKLNDRLLISISKREHLDFLSSYATGDTWINKYKNVLENSEGSIVFNWGEPTLRNQGADFQILGNIFSKKEVWYCKFQTLKKEKETPPVLPDPFQVLHGCISAPYSHQTQQGNIITLLQDTLNNIQIFHFPEGKKHIYKARGKLKSPIYPLQIKDSIHFAFCTDKYIHFINKKGEAAQGYPIKVSDKIRHGSFAYIPILKRHHIFLGTDNGKIFGLDLSKGGKPLGNWNPVQLSSPLAFPLQYIFTNEKEFFIAIQKNGTISYFNKKGKSAYPDQEVPLEFLHHFEHSFQGDANDRLIMHSPSGKLKILKPGIGSFGLSLNENGKKTSQFLSFHSSGDSLLSYIGLNGTEFVIKGYQNNKFTTLLKNTVPKTGGKLFSLNDNIYLHDEKSKDVYFLNEENIWELLPIKSDFPISLLAYERRPTAITIYGNKLRKEAINSTTK